MERNTLLAARTLTATGLGGAKFAESTTDTAENPDPVPRKEVPPA